VSHDSAAGRAQSPGVPMGASRRSVAMVLAWSFVDLYALAMRNPVDGATFQASLDRVAQYRKVTLTPLASVLMGYPQARSGEVECVASKTET
jgi:hypothetical protein